MLTGDSPRGLDLLLGVGHGQESRSVEARLHESHNLLGALEATIGDFADPYNRRRVDESLGNVARADADIDRALSLARIGGVSCSA